MALIALSLSACSDSDSDRSNNATVEENKRPELELSFTEAPINLPGVTANFAADVSYGDAERNVFDIYLPDCEGSTPLVIYIHGGGFTGGNKSTGHERDGDLIIELLQQCVAWAGINYTLLEVPAEGEDMEAAAAQGGVRTSLDDTARALQFMRYHFESLNIDIENVATYGGSAGAGAGLWLGTQATYDILDWETILLPITEPFAAILGGTDIPTVAQAVGATNYLLTILGISNIDQLDSAELAEYRADVDMLELMDSGDAPIYVQNYTVSLDNLLNVFLHHGVHALAVKARADEVGLHSVAYSEDPQYLLEDPSGEGLVSFLLRHIR